MMSDLLAQFGMSGSSGVGLTPTYAPHFIIANFVLSYVLGSTRGAKVRLGIDHNVSPREDIAKYGPVAVKEGKLTDAQLRRLQRQQSAHENSVEHFPFFVGAALVALQAGLPNAMINKYCLVYTLVRVGYTLAYAQIEDNALSFVRTGFWWASNITCMRLFWFAGKALNKSF